MAKNLAPGTTAADIESAMTPVGGVVLGCRLIAERPKVIAELIFESKEGADNVVETFNNQNVSKSVFSIDMPLTIYGIG
jgi:RNA recognition motif